MLRCADDSFYVGSTRNLDHRLQQHAIGKGAVYTSTRLPVIEGTPEVDRTLVADGGRWSPRAQTRAFQWKADGQPVAGATGRHDAVGWNQARGRAGRVRRTAQRAAGDGVPVMPLTASDRHGRRRPVEVPSRATSPG